MTSLLMQATVQSPATTAPAIRRVGNSLAQTRGGLPTLQAFASWAFH